MSSQTPSYPARPLSRHALRLSVYPRVCIPLLSLALLWACENPIDTTPNVFPDPIEIVDMETTPQTPEACSDCLTEGAWYRFDLLKLVTLDGEPHPVIGILNGMWGTDVERHVLNVLFEVRSVTATQVVMGAMNAAWVSEDDDGYCLMPETAIEFIFNRNGCAIENSTTAGINIYAGSLAIPKNCSFEGGAINAIPVREVILGGTFTDECNAISGGNVISAAIKKRALEETCSCLSPSLDGCLGIDPSFEGNNFGECGGCNRTYNSLARQLTTIRPLDWNCEVDGEQAVCIEAEFSAERLNFTPATCAE